MEPVCCSMPTAALMRRVITRPSTTCNNRGKYFQISSQDSLVQQPQKLLFLWVLYLAVFMGAISCCFYGCYILLFLWVLQLAGYFYWCYRLLFLWVLYLAVFMGAISCCFYVCYILLFLLVLYLAVFMGAITCCFYECYS